MFVSSWWLSYAKDCYVISVPLLFCVTWHYGEEQSPESDYLDLNPESIT